MKRIFIFLVAVILAACSVDNVDKSDKSAHTMQLPQASVYELFPTTNMWTFIQLDTRNGQMWQVQYDVKGENRMRTVLNAESLSGAEAPFEGRFTLYPTQNMYTFILLDRAFGRTWQVQWSFDEEYRLVVPIQ